MPAEPQPKIATHTLVKLKGCVSVFVAQFTAGTSFNFERYNFFATLKRFRRLLRLQQFSVLPCKLQLGGSLFNDHEEKI